MGHPNRPATTKLAGHMTYALQWSSLPKFSQDFAFLPPPQESPPEVQKPISPRLVVDYLQICRDGIRLRLGVRLDTSPDPKNPSKRMPAALYKRIQVACPPPTREGRAWEFGTRVSDGTEDGQPLPPTDDTWKDRGVFTVEGIPSLDQPEPSTIVFDRWLALPSSGIQPKIFTFTEEVDTRGFLSISYPQPHIGEEGAIQVGMDYFAEYMLKWSSLLPPNAYVAISLDRFWPPERESPDYIAQVQDCLLTT